MEWLVLVGLVLLMVAIFVWGEQKRGVPVISLLTKKEEEEKNGRGV